jgi:hypothetical protein
VTILEAHSPAPLCPLQPVYDWALDVGCPDCGESMTAVEVLFETWRCVAHGPWFNDPDRGVLFAGTVTPAVEARSA